jgi:hypothetical protein
MMGALRMKYVFTVLLLALLGACGTTSNSEPAIDNGQKPSMEQFGRMPMPAGTKLRPSDSLIFGAADGWLGRAVFEIPTDGNQAYNFFADQMPRQGWNLVASVRGKKSLLVFTRAERSATIEIEDVGLFGNSIVSMTVAPVGSTGASSGNSGVVVQPVGASPRRP